MTSSGESLEKVKRKRWRVFDTRRCFFTKSGFEIWDFHNLHTHWNCMRYLTGSLERISTWISNGRVGSGSGRESPGVIEEEDGEVRVPAEEFGSDKAASFGSSVSLLGGAIVKVVPPSPILPSENLQS